MSNRRTFLRSAALSTLSAGALLDALARAQARTKRPVLISTWDHGLPANAKGWEILDSGGYALDAVEQGIRVVEADPKSMSVGYGGLPDRDGKVTLDACIMDEQFRCGAVAFLQEIKHPVSVARRVMDQTPYVMLAGEGALQFALAQGFKRENLLTPEAEAVWQKWLKNSNYKPGINWENHDTIGMLGLDHAGKLCGACSTSGMAFKMHGRIGDSPLIGAGLYVNGAAGAACATGNGELMIRVAGSHAVVELMRQGKSPQKACQLVVQRIVEAHPKLDKDMQVGFLALSPKGQVGAFSLWPGFNYALCDADGNRLLDAPSLWQ